MIVTLDHRLALRRYIHRRNFQPRNLPYQRKAQHPRQPSHQPRGRPNIQHRNPPTSLPRPRPSHRPETHQSHLPDHQRGNRPSNRPKTQRRLLPKAQLGNLPSNRPNPRLGLLPKAHRNHQRRHLPVRQPRLPNHRLSHLPRLLNLQHCQHQLRPSHLPHLPPHLP